MSAGKHHLFSEDRASEGSPSPEPVERMVLSELVEIRDKLEVQMCCLAEREGALKEREERVSQLESLLASTQDQLAQCIEQEVQRRLSEYKSEVDRLEGAVQQKRKDNVRLRNSFETVQLANKTLKQQLDEIRSHNERLESQLTSMQGRLKNLQRKMEHSDKIKTCSHLPRSNKTTSTQTSPWTAQSTPTPSSSTITQLLALLMPMVTDRLSSSPHHLSRPSHMKMLQLLCQLLPALTPSLELPCVQFIYSILLQISKEERSHLTSTLRRIGEQVYQPSAPCRLYKSADLVIQTYSILVILATTTQVDVICEVLQMLRNTLTESEQCRQLFLSNSGVELLVNLSHPINKVTVGLIVDIFLQLSADSAHFSQFLKACASEQWFSMAASLLSHYSSVELHTLEKLSILLQRMSKLKNCRRHFESCKIPSSLQNLLAVDGLQAQAPFLALNLQSTLMNLTT